jgi:two-component system, chemotaxis family, CheB/CheR fusion protein
LTQSRLIRDLLDLSRLRSGKISLNMETVSLATSIKNAVETVRSDAHAQEITIGVAAPSEPLFVNGDPVRLEQIIWNLLNNSVKFTPSGGRITVTLARENGQALLTVEDTGQGLMVHFYLMSLSFFARRTRARAALSPVWVSVSLWCGNWLICTRVLSLHSRLGEVRALASPSNFP